MPVESERPNVASIDDGSIYVLDEKKCLYALDVTKQPQQESWESRAPLPVDDSYPWISMTAAQGKLFVAGGRETSILAWYIPKTGT